MIKQDQLQNEDSEPLSPELLEMIMKGPQWTAKALQDNTEDES